MTTYDDIEIVSLKPQLCTVIVEGERCTLYEASEQAAIDFRDAAIQAAKMDDGEVVGMDGVSSASSQLVWACLYRADNSQFDLAAVRRWPARIIKPLFERIKLMSDLDETVTEAGVQRQIARLQRRLQRMQLTETTAKNGHAPTGATSS